MSSVASDLTIGADASDETMRAQLDDGFGHIKVKVGLDPGDVRRVVRIHEAAEGRVRIRVDANQAWDVGTALSALGAWRAAGVDIEAIEQPLPRADLAGHAALRARQPVPVMLDESVFDVDDARRALDAGAADVVNIKLAKCGGFHAAQEIADLARAAGVRVMIGSMMESRLGVAAAASLAAVVAPDEVHDVDMAWWVADGLPSAYRDGRFLLADDPGVAGVTDAVRGSQWTVRA